MDKVKTEKEGNKECVVYSVRARLFPYTFPIIPCPLCIEERLRQERLEQNSALARMMRVSIQAKISKKMAALLEAKLILDILLQKAEKRIEMKNKNKDENKGENKKKNKTKK